MDNTPIYSLISFFFIIWILPISLRVRKMKKRSEKHFDVERLRKLYKHMKMAILFTLLFLLLSIYWYYYPTFTLFVIFAWIGTFTSFMLIFGAIFEIHAENRRKWHLIDLIRENYTDDLLELAKTLEYPYSILKQIIDYLDQKNELFFRFQTVNKFSIVGMDRI